MSARSRVKVPTILQMEAVECGAAALAMILAYYKKYVPLEELRIACGVSRDGSKANNILKAARNYGLEAKGFRKEIEAIKSDIQPPAIIFWNFNHFVVFEGFHQGYAHINDPGSGHRKISEEEFDQSFTGVVLTFVPGKDFKKSGSPPSLLTALSQRIKGSETALVFLILVGIALVLPGLVIPVFSKVFVDDILIGGKADWLSTVLLGMFLTTVLRGTLTWIEGYYLQRLETKVALRNASHFLWHILRLPVEFYSQRFPGDISSRMQSNNDVAKLMSGELAKTVLDCMLLFFYLFLMMTYSVSLALIGVVAALVNVIVLRYVAQRRIELNGKLLQDKGKLMGVSMAGLQSIETIKGTGSESDFFAKWSGYHAKTLNAEQEMGFTSQYLASVPHINAALTDALVLALGGLFVMNGDMTMGSLVAFQSLMGSFMAPVQSLVGMGGQLQEIEGTMNRLDDVLRYPLDAQVANSSDAEEKEMMEECPDSSKLEGYVEIKDLTFGYSRLEPPLIANFNLTLKPGERVALVGGSGSGKSTIAKIITGVLQPWSGDILLDGQRKETIPRWLINESLAVVDQDICMFEGTIRDNLSLWDDTLPDQEMIQAAKDAFIHDAVSMRPGGYDNKIDEGGKNFSGGQRQRLEIARALANNPSILVLDEATSALDTVTEKAVDDNIRRRGCTCIIVAHRLSTIRDCDEIIVLERGKIVQRGNHEELIKTKGHYAALLQTT